MEGRSDESNARSRRAEIREQVRAGQKTPRQADHDIALLGFSTGDDGAADHTQAAIWRVSLAVLFYSWMDVEQVRKEWFRLCRWGRHLRSDPVQSTQVMSLDEAEHRLRADLVAGIVRSFGSSPDESAAPIPRETWNSVDDLLDPNMFVYDEARSQQFEGPYVLRHEVFPLWIGDRSPTSTATRNAARPDFGGSTRKPMGAPQKYDWPAAAGFIGGYIADKDYPEHQAEVVMALEQWFATRGRTPDRRDSERFVAELYKARPARAR